jgi:sulfonate transport system substrate-binding protein
VLSTGVGLTSNNSYYLASRALTHDPRTLKALFDALSEADAWVKSNRTETAHFLSVESGLPLSTTIRFLERRTAGPITRLKAGRHRRPAARGRHVLGDPEADRPT